MGNEQGIGGRPRSLTNGRAEPPAADRVASQLPPTTGKRRSNSGSSRRFPELVLSKESPLYQSIRSGETKPSRYVLIEADGD